jgi:hypothetical protein
VKVVNEPLGGKPVVIVHQPQSDTTTAFVARARGKTLTFAAANDKATELRDTETGSRWTAYGECTAGALKGATLEPLILEPEYDLRAAIARTRCADHPFGFASEGTGVVSVAPFFAKIIASSFAGSVWLALRDTS